jgi:putative endonuclease
MKKKNVVYILECADGTMYVGSTNDLEKRLHQHNHLKCGAHYTKIRRPVELRHSETFKTLNQARKRECEIKGWKREKKLELITRVRKV